MAMKQSIIVLIPMHPDSLFYGTPFSNPDELKTFSPVDKSLFMMNFRI